MNGQQISKLDLLKYKGDKKNGMPHGYGTLKKKKFRYEGNWKDGKFHGYGTLFEDEGNDEYGRQYKHEYEGEFYEGRKHGQGTWKMWGGSKVVGEFKNDEPWNIEDFNSSGKLVNKLVNGEMINDTSLNT